MPHIEGYADFLVEATRKKLGFDSNDSAHDSEVLRKLQAGEKLSKSKHLQEEVKKGCQVCGTPLVTEEEKELKWCTKHLDEFDRMCGW